MISFFPSDLGCKDTHRHDGVPVGPAWGQADNLPGQHWPLSTIGSPGADFHHGQKLVSASQNRPKIRLQSVPFATTMVPDIIGWFSEYRTGNPSESQKNDRRA
jgi:hypothetical protein